MKALLVLCAALALASAKSNYDGYKVYRLIAKTDEQSDFLHNLEDDDRLDFWTDPNKISMPVDVMVNPVDQDSFLERIASAGIDASVFIDNVQPLIQEEEKQMKLKQLARNGMDWTSYHDLSGIYSWLRTLPGLHPGKVTLEVGGTTYENREILGVKISFGSGKKAVFIEGGIHAREWISPATVTYLIDQVLNSDDPEFRQIAESFDWYLFPVTNPDGYEYTHRSNRLWRKTRSRGSLLCVGVDPNRNWDIYWRVAGTSNSACAENYGGSKAFSEIETESLSKYISTIGSSLVSYISFHSYSQLLLLPYGHTAQHLDNYAVARRIGDKAADALASRYGTRYIVGNIVEAIYPASGGSSDWVKDRYKPPLVYTYELRDRGQFGFVLPASQIIPNNLEVLDSIKTIFKEGEKEGLYTLS